jgi:hypothetical protein
MNLPYITTALGQNKAVFENLLSGIDEQTYLWKPSANKWCLLEIVCHLYDEEREDFRARVKHVLETPEKSFPPFDPIGMVKTGNYIEQNYHEMVTNFLSERTLSVDWLGSLSAPAWENTTIHPRIGPMSADLLLNNWLAHDYLHFRQITRLKYQFLQMQSGQDLSYAGLW